VQTASETQHRPAESLLTRHVFLDTQVYRALGHNQGNPALATLKEQIEAHHVVLHTTDITLLEIRRQICELVQAHQRELGKIEKDFNRWREQAPGSAPTVPLGFDGEALSAEPIAARVSLRTVAPRDRGFREAGAGGSNPLTPTSLNPGN
jgi:hypothetical protein